MSITVAALKKKYGSIRKALRGVLSSVGKLFRLGRSFILDNSSFEIPVLRQKCVGRYTPPPSKKISLYSTSVNDNFSVPFLVANKSSIICKFYLQ